MTGNKNDDNNVNEVDNKLQVDAPRGIPKDALQDNLNPQGTPKDDHQVAPTMSKKQAAATR
jgi:hypothetical protein